MKQRQIPRGAAFLCVGTAALTTIVFAGDINPPPGPVGPSGPSLGDLLQAVGGSGASSTTYQIRTIPTPPAGAFEIVSSTDGVLERVVLTNGASTDPLVVHLKDTTGVLTQCVIPAGQTQSLALGIGYTAPLEVATIGLNGFIGVSVIVQENN